MKRIEIRAERQEYIRVKAHFYALDFVAHCASGKLNIEADGDRWHSEPMQIRRDNLRDNDLQTDRWRLLRFNGKQINEEMELYCLPTIIENVNNLGGADDGGSVARRINLDATRPRQLSLFDDEPG